MNNIIFTYFSIFPFHKQSSWTTRITYSTKPTAGDHYPLNHNNHMLVQPKVNVCIDLLEIHILGSFCRLDMGDFNLVINQTNFNFALVIFALLLNLILSKFKGRFFYFYVLLFGFQLFIAWMHVVCLCFVDWYLYGLNMVLVPKHVLFLLF